MSAVLEIPFSIKQPIPEIFQAWELLSSAADAHLSGDYEAAEAMFQQADLAEVWHWTNPASGRPDLNVRVRKPDGDTQRVPKDERDPIRDIRQDPMAAPIRMAVLARDGFRCRYCHIPVISADIWYIMRNIYPNIIALEQDKPRNAHAAFQCMWLQYDHVVPHWHGGMSSTDNVVICCCLCNFGKDKYTLRQLGISDPRLRPPEPVSWDGLERLRACGPIRRKRLKSAATKAPSPSAENAFFLPGAWISGAYLYTQPLAGKERWFAIGPGLRAEPIVRNGVSGCRLWCHPKVFQSRGLNPTIFLDEDDALGLNPPV